ncbi:MAG: ferrous iron transport protein A [Thermoplasmata archaeon]
MVIKDLYEMKYEEKGKVVDIDPELRNKVAGMGIREGKKLKFTTKHPIKGPVVVEVEGSTTSMGIGIAKNIQVEVK